MLTSVRILLDFALVLVAGPSDGGATFGFSLGTSTSSPPVASRIGSTVVGVGSTGSLNWVKF